MVPTATAPRAYDESVELKREIAIINVAQFVSAQKSADAFPGRPIASAFKPLRRNRRRGIAARFFTYVFNPPNCTLTRFVSCFVTVIAGDRLPNASHCNPLEKHVSFFFLSTALCQQTREKSYSLVQNKLINFYFLAVRKELTFASTRLCHAAFEISGRLNFVRRLFRQSRREATKQRDRAISQRRNVSQ